MANKEELKNLCDQYGFTFLWNPNSRSYHITGDKLSHFGGLYHTAKSKQFIIAEESLDIPGLLSEVEEWILERIVIMAGEK
jgi:hypothetical protein